MTVRDDPTATGVWHLRLRGEYAAAITAASRLTPADPVEVRLLGAERARLAYYQGRFRQGREIAEALIGAPDLASARAAVASSLNALALNRGHLALARINDALLRLRMLRAPIDDTVDARIQLVHVLAHMGDRATSISTARASLTIARSGASVRSYARAEYALGFALALAGEEEAIERLVAAERLARPQGGTLWHWILFCLATCLRDLGFSRTAGVYRARTEVSLRHERAWFHIRERELGSIAIWTRPPITADERPFLRAVLAAQRLHDPTLRKRGRVFRLALRAAREFASGGLHHWGWGALWIAAADPTAPSDARRRVAEEVIANLERSGSRHWGFFDPHLAYPWIRRLGASRRLVDHIEATLRARPGADAVAIVDGLGVFDPAAVPALLEAGLSPIEISTVVHLLDRWLDGAAVQRSALAADCGVSEGTLRARMNRIRAKLGIERARGVVPILAYLADRELLAPLAASRAIRRLAG